MNRNLIFVSALFAALGAATAATADERTDCTDQPQTAWMTEDAIRAKATDLGYDVRDVRVEGSCYEVYAMSNGERVELAFDPATGSVVATGSSDDE